MIIPRGSTDVGPDGFVKKTKTKAAGSVADILASVAKEPGYIHITYTEQGVVVEWSSAQPAMTLSQYLRAMAGEFSRTKESTDDSDDSSRSE